MTDYEYQIFKVILFMRGCFGEVETDLRSNNSK